MVPIDINLKKLKQLHTKGLSDSEIGREFNCSSTTIANRRKNLNLPSNQGVTINGVHIKGTSIKKFVLEPLVKQELTDKQIGKILGFCEAAIWKARKILDIKRGNLKTVKSIKPTKKQLSILIGHLLGDGSLSKLYTNTTGKICQGIAQKDYTLWKAKELSPLSGKVTIYTRKSIDKRNGNIYTSCESYLKANPELNWLYDLFYCKGYKEVSLKMLYYLTPLSLAVWYMDDGYISKDGYYIATDSFKNHRVLKAMFKKFNLLITIDKRGRIYIPSMYAKKFATIVYPYILPMFHYKIHQSHVTPLIQGKSSRR
jgi:biotin operon repressor